MTKLLKFRSHFKDLNCLTPSALPPYFRSSLNTFKRLYFDVKFSEWLGWEGLSSFTMVLHSLRPKNVECAPKIKNSCSLKIMFSPIVHVIITNKVSVAILQSYFSFMRHICIGVLQKKGGLFRHIYVHQLIACNLAKDLKTSKENYVWKLLLLYFHHWLLSYLYVMLQKLHFD